MAWDSSRPVPYRRLLKEWLLYAAVMVAVFLLFLRDSTSPAGMALGLIVSLPLWIGLSWVLAKFGYQRKTLSDLRSEREQRAAAGSSRSVATAATVPERARPAPTKRTSIGPTNRPQRKRR